MEKFEFKSYREDLAKEIYQEPDKERRRDILAKARMTEEYQEARELKINQERVETGDQKLLGYIEKHSLGEYIISKSDSDYIKLLSLVEENRREFKEEIWPNISDELINKAFDFVEGKRDEQLVNLFKRANFDYQSLLTEELDEAERVGQLLEAILKAESYDEAVEKNRGTRIDFSGFENDPDISDAKEFIYNAFGTDLLERCLISKVNYMPDKVLLRVAGADYLLPEEDYKEWQEEMSEIKKNKFRAESFTTWNTHPTFNKKFIPTHIIFCSLYNEQLNELAYLDSVPTEEKMRLYKLGTIAHEVAHHIYDYLMDSDRRSIWQSLVDKTETLTDYAKSYSSHDLRYDESFTEAVRLKTTVPSYLKREFPEIDQFLTDNFPEII